MRRIMAQPLEKLQRARLIPHSGFVQRELSPSRAVQPADRASDDPSLVEALRRGEPEAFERLVRAYQHRIFSIALRMLGDRGDAEEVAQEVFLRVHRSIGRFRGEAKLSTWLYAITSRLCLNRMRAPGRGRRAGEQALGRGAHGDPTPGGDAGGGGDPGGAPPGHCGAGRGKADCGGAEGSPRAGLRRDCCGPGASPEHGAVAPPPRADGAEGAIGAILVMNCREARELFSTKADDLLTAEQRAALDGHLQGCADCRHEWERFRQTVSLLHSVGEARAPAGFGRRGMEASRREPGHRRLLRGVFLPLHVRLPPEGAALVLVSTLAIFLYRQTPELQRAVEAPQSGVVASAPDAPAKSAEAG